MTMIVMVMTMARMLTMTMILETRFVPLNYTINYTVHWPNIKSQKWDIASTLFMWFKDN